MAISKSQHKYYSTIGRQPGLANRKNRPNGLFLERGSNTVYKTIKSLDLFWKKRSLFHMY